jgi:hypothetical protein
MNTTAKIALIAAAVVVVAGAVYMVDIDTVEEARLPDVELSVEGGNLPEYDAQVGSISVDTETEQVTVPDVEITTQEMDVEVPKLRINPPADDS